MVKICPALTAVLPRWKIQTLQPKNFFLKLLFPHWTHFLAVRKHKESRGELAYNRKALLSQFLQELHSCQLSSGILEREAVLPSRQCSLLDGASWNAALSLPVCMENSGEAGKEHQQDWEISLESSEGDTQPSTVRVTCWTGVIDPAQREEFGHSGNCSTSSLLSVWRIPKAAEGLHQPRVGSSGGTTGQFCYQGGSGWSLLFLSLLMAQ